VAVGRTLPRSHQTVNARQGSDRPWPSPATVGSTAVVQKFGFSSTRRFAFFSIGYTDFVEIEFKIYSIFLYTHSVIFYRGLRARVHGGLHGSRLRSGCAIPALFALPPSSLRYILHSPHHSSLLCPQAKFLLVFKIRLLS
jgi:hypothetical protein